MPIEWGPIIGSIAGGAIDAWSQDRANKANAGNVRAQIDFQQQQSETAYQRAVDDLKKAGLNPAMAYMQGGNSSMAGASAQAQPVLSGTGQRIATALQLSNDLATGSAQRQLITQQAAAASAQASKTMGELQLMQPAGILAQSPDYQKLFANTEISKRNRELLENSNYPALFRAQLANTGAATAAAQASASEAQSRTVLNQQLFQNDWFRKNISPYINSSAKAIGLFKDVTNLNLNR